LVEKIFLIQFVSYHLMWTSICLYHMWLCFHRTQ
jgi:hypothetical protein